MKTKNRGSEIARGNKKGIALIFLYLVLMVLTILFVSLMNSSFSESRAALRNKDAVEASNICEAGIDQVTRDLYEKFSDYFTDQGQLISAFVWFDDLPNPVKCSLPVNVSLGSGTYTVAITNVDSSVNERRQVTLVSTATVNGITKQATAVMSYELAPSQVFDYAYFINNFGWFWGNTIKNNGDIRANGDMSFGSYQPEINGDIYAAENAEIGALGEIDGDNKYRNINSYRGSAGAAARPSNPAADPQDIDMDGELEQFPYPDGYDGYSEKFTGIDPVEMPYLGDLEQYKTIAVAESGTVSQGGAVLINNVLDTTGDDSIVLVGTDVNPIVLNGPVVVAGDVLIKGVVTGQGSIYAGRNVHIIGDIKYKNGPSWAKPDTSPEATDTLNDSKDFLSLEAKGSVVIGDYTSGTFNANNKTYLKPPFTQAYEVDPTDAANGYVDYYVDGKPYFNGDYTADDGGRKETTGGIDAGARKFYESSFDDAYFKSLCAGKVSRVDAVCYTNHAFTGNLWNAVVNGIVVARDEAIIYTGNLEYNYDIRAKPERLGEKVYLPRSLAMPNLVYLKKD